MKIAILGWGSLIWDPRELEIAVPWHHDGPQLPIEFARISSRNRLTLVIKPGWDNVTTLWGLSSLDSLNNARENLKTREGTENLNNIGYYDFLNNTYSSVHLSDAIKANLIAWNGDKKMDAIIWSDFSENFLAKYRLPFTIINVIRFLGERTPEEYPAVKEYNLKTPPQIQTRFRIDSENYLLSK
jgi:hypothetical protein